MWYDTLILIIQFFLRYFLFTSYLYQSGLTSLLCAASHNHVDVVRALLEGGANIEAKDNVCTKTFSSVSWWLCVCKRERESAFFLLLLHILRLKRFMISLFSALCTILWRCFSRYCRYCYHYYYYYCWCYFYSFPFICIAYVNASRYF